VLVTAASVQDRDGARPLLAKMIATCERVRLVWADGGYAGKLLYWARDTLHLRIQIVKRSDDQIGFVVLPRRWVVERTVAWIIRHRRCARDYEALAAHHESHGLLGHNPRHQPTPRQPAIGSGTGTYAACSCSSDPTRYCDGTAT
jgi:transposase